MGLGTGSIWAAMRYAEKKLSPIRMGLSEQQLYCGKLLNGSFSITAAGPMRAPFLKASQREREGLCPLLHRKTWMLKPRFHLHVCSHVYTHATLTAFQPQEEHCLS